MTGPEQVLVEDWCQQYPSHSVGTVEFGPDGALYASGGDGASFTFADYGQDGTPAQPLRRPARAASAPRCAADRRGRRAAQPGPAHDRAIPSTLDGIDHPRRSGDGRRPADEPARSELRSERAAHHRLRPAQSVPLHVPAGDERALDRRRRLERLGGDQPHPRSRRRGRRELRLAVLRGALARSRATTRPNLSICENLYDAPSDDTKPFFAYHHNNKVVAGESCPTGSSSIAGHLVRVRPGGRQLPGRVPAAPSSSPTTRGTASGR